MKVAGLVAASALAMALAGCGVGPGGSSVESNGTATGIAAKAVHGTVHGGQQPISGATIQLYAVGITGLKSASTALISSTVTTNGGGGFNISGDWNCTSNTAVYGINPLLYIVATGGNPGGSAGTNNNAAIVLMAALGPCSGVGPQTDILLDEMTTVAAVYALAPFMQDAFHVGAQGANAVGLVNAFNTAGLLVNVASGSAPGNLPANATAPVIELNTLGDIAAACVNSSGMGGSCSMLFSDTTINGSVPSDIVGALLNIANNPAAMPGTLLDIIPTQPPFQTMLGNAPSDWTVALKFTGGGLNRPTGIALDATGNVWVANSSGNSVTEISSTGNLLTGAGGYASNSLFGAQGIAVDKTGNVWVADTLLSTVVKLTMSQGAIQSSTSYSAGGIDGPTSLAIDSQNNVWVSNFAGGSITELNSQGAAVGASPLTAGGLLQSPVGIGIDADGNVWVADHTAGLIDEFANNQTLLSGTGFTDGSMIAPQALAFKPSGPAWIADIGINATSLFGANGTSLLSVPYAGGGLAMPAAIAVDGNGTAWVANSQTAGSISPLSYVQSGVVSPAAGLGSLNMPAGIAIDASGSVWTANAGDNSVSEFVGVAAPAVMPLAAGVGP